MAQPYSPPCERGTIEAEACPREEGREIASADKAYVLAACVLASSMAFIDGSALTVALPQLRQELDAELAMIQWVLNGYVLALAALTLVGGAMADSYGRTRMVLIGAFGFALASIACALAPNVEWLIFARVIQGVAAALLTPASLALIGSVYPKDERSRAIGIWAAASALTTAAGPVLGGWLVETFGWQAIFWINPPLAAAAIVLLIVFAPPDRKKEQKFDLLGAAAIALSLFGCAWALSLIGGGESGASSGIQTAPVGRIAFAALLAIGAGFAFVYRQRHASDPMTPPRLFSNTAFTGLNIATLLIYAGLSIMFFLLPFELVEDRGVSPSRIGLLILPFTLGVGLLSRAFGGIADNMGPKRLLVSGAVMACLAFILFAAGENWTLWTGIVLPMSILGLAFAILVAPLTSAVMSSVSDNDAGFASGINNTASRVAQLIGVAFAAGMATSEIGYVVGMIIAAATCALGAVVVAFSIQSDTANS